MEYRSSVLVIGGGIGGLSAALKLAQFCDVIVVMKEDRFLSSTYFAQGGIASVFSKEDTFESHIQDTLRAGDGLCHEEVVQSVVEEGPIRVRELIEIGVSFSRNAEEVAYDLGREGGHSQRRILHAEDFTGREIQRALVEAVEKAPRIRIFENHIAVDLITTEKFGLGRGINRGVGAYILNRGTGQIDTFLSHFTVLATGGLGKVYLYTSNPDVATGDGVAMAYRAGADIANMEFIQFHPTCLYHPHAKSFLISEAVRGEGGILRLAHGEAFMERHHPMKELAPRDIVARAIDHEIKRTGNDCVYLDVTHLNPEFIKKRFPNIYEKCLSLGIDMVQEPVPVVPAAHYACGGVVTNLKGETTTPRLFACGEVACTGLHGANRLASNSLLEAIVFAHRIAEEIRGEYDKDIAQEALPDVPPWNPGGARDSDEEVVIAHNWDEIRRTLWNYVGIVRSNKRLMRARHRIDNLMKEIDEYYWNFTVTGDLIELRNLSQVADLIVRSAMQRQESRGLHYNIDYLRKDDRFLRDTLLKKS
ncbi:MAG: L-aspartate oxidase [Deltaproteobacteria bacterium]|nr:L-aspartate oxidase [Deltaproteobacteria bacterium]